MEKPSKCSMKTICNKNGNFNRKDFGGFAKRNQNLFYSDILLIYSIYF